MRVNRETARKIEEMTGHAAPVRRKYRNVPVTVGGVKFHSQKEADRWAELKLLEQAGKIESLSRQRPFPLCTFRGGEFVKVAIYVADFCYAEDGKVVVEDCKGYRTALYKLKRRWMLAQYGIEIRET